MSVSINWILSLGFICLQYLQYVVILMMYNHFFTSTSCDGLYHIMPIKTPILKSHSTSFSPNKYDCTVPIIRVNTTWNHSLSMWPWIIRDWNYICYFQISPNIGRVEPGTNVGGFQYLYYWWTQLMENNFSCIKHSEGEFLPHWPASLAHIIGLYVHMHDWGHLDSWFVTIC